MTGDQSTVTADLCGTAMVHDAALQKLVHEDLMFIALLLVGIFAIIVIIGCVTPKKTP